VYKPSLASRLSLLTVFFAGLGFGAGISEGLLGH
jgi:demethoxyubiquinone hydroxylase (CLK1/Coq7/Cat5 family)